MINKMGPCTNLQQRWVLEYSYRQAIWQVTLLPVTFKAILTDISRLRERLPNGGPVFMIQQNLVITRLTFQTTDTLEI